MDRGFTVILMALAGGAVAIQPALNAGLSRATGSLPAALISFLVGATMLCVIVLLSGQITRLGASVEVRWYYLLGGACGAIWITMSLIAVKSLGAGGVVAATISGQLTGAMIADHFGVLDLTTTPVTVERVIGVLLLAAGTYLIVR